ncbi:MAG: hypothetical protein EOP88_18820 [Verrucomicrobiaceae bacterium]|nr:MAG: hypothetical protein EOP88_18820 [Verrucomicrobiaceae bacterium]
MHPRFPLALLLAAVSVTTALAETRAWKSADGTRSVQGEFVKSDAASVTIRNSAGKEVVIERTKLHVDDIKWLADRDKPAPVAQDPNAFFDNLTFNDTRETATAKLKASKIVEMTTDETFIGRSGLNGVFRTRKKVGQLDAFLYFDWTEAGKLKELNVQTTPRPESAYKTELEPSWTEFIELLSALYGKPVHKGPMPPAASLTADAFVPSHFWNLEKGGCAMLGTAREGTTYQVIVRFTQKKPQVVELP